MNTFYKVDQRMWKILPHDKVENLNYTLKNKIVRYVAIEKVVWLWGVVCDVYCRSNNRWSYNICGIFPNWKLFYCISINDDLIWPIASLCTQAPFCTHGGRNLQLNKYHQNGENPKFWIFFPRKIVIFLSKSLARSYM